MPAKQQTTLAARQKATPDEEETPVYVMVVKEGDKTYRLKSDELGPADRLACRQQTGLSLQEVMSRFDTDSVLFVLWLARRKSGEPNLAFNQVLSKYPTDASLGKIDFHVEDRDGNEVEVDEDPLVATGA
jgi:hypothetical protein